MKKVPLKLSVFDMDCMMRLLEHAIYQPNQYGYDLTSDNDKLILATLGEFYERLNAAHSPFKGKYKLNIIVSQAIAFKMHCLAMPAQISTTVQQIRINRIIGIIDQQTI